MKTGVRFAVCIIADEASYVIYHVGMRLIEGVKFLGYFFSSVSCIHSQKSFKQPGNGLSILAVGAYK